MHLNDLLRLNGASFVETAYSVILKRQVDRSGLDHFMNRLASGDSKEAIIVILATSTEARGSRIDLTGLPTLIRKRGKSPLRRFLRYFSQFRDMRRQVARIEYIISQQAARIEYIISQQEVIAASNSLHHPIIVEDRDVGQAHARIPGDGLHNTLVSIQDSLSNTAHDADLFIENFRKTIRSSPLFFVMSH
ncbi:DUF4214 domain-containing protein [Sphingobium yanoikuyae]|uniref:DUF4214 domain-containing protein n=1 Tax=Sphingobium yanoikuyae TaxID=13690 RepID=UPI003B8ED1C7